MSVFALRRTSYVSRPTGIVVVGDSNVLLKSRTLLAFPIQNKATAARRVRASQQGDGDYMSLWAGQGYPLARRLSAAELVRSIAEEYGRAVEHLVGTVRR